MFAKFDGFDWRIVISAKTKNKSKNLTCCRFGNLVLDNDFIHDALTCIVICNENPKLRGRLGDIVFF